MTLELLHSVPQFAPSRGSRQCGSSGNDPNNAMTISTQQREGTPGEVLAAFTRLGLTSFGGPIAHIGYFREAFVVRRKWLD
jgi:hypothetical protein